MARVVLQRFRELEVRIRKEDANEQGLQDFERKTIILSCT